MSIKRDFRQNRNDQVNNSTEYYPTRLLPKNNPDTYITFAINQTDISLNREYHSIKTVPHICQFASNRRRTHLRVHLPSRPYAYQSFPPHTPHSNTGHVDTYMDSSCDAHHPISYISLSHPKPLLRFSKRTPSTIHFKANTKLSFFISKFRHTN